MALDAPSRGSRSLAGPILDQLQAERRHLLGHRGLLGEPGE